MFQRGVISLLGNQIKITVSDAGFFVIESMHFPARSIVVLNFEHLLSPRLLIMNILGWFVVLFMGGLQCNERAIRSHPLGRSTSKVRTLL